MKYSIHEIVWQRDLDGNVYSRSLGCGPFSRVWLWRRQPSKYVTTNNSGSNFQYVKMSIRTFHSNPFSIQCIISSDSRWPKKFRSQSVSLFFNHEATVESDSDWEYPAGTTPKDFRTRPSISGEWTAWSNEYLQIFFNCKLLTDFMSIFSLWIQRTLGFSFCKQRPRQPGAC